MVEEKKEACPEVIPPTEMIYYQYDGNFELECDAKILEIEQKEKGGKFIVEIALDRTVMHAQGGGQPSDIGQISFQHDDKNVVVSVEKVLINRESGVATHRGTVEELAGLPGKGTSVRVSVDADNRRLISECHSAGHAVDMAMTKIGQSLRPTKGYHFMEGPYVEYEGSIPPEQRPEVLKALLQAFKDLVEEDIATEIDTLPEDKASEVCNKIAKNFDMKDFGGGKEEPTDIRIVTVAGFPCPCGGTHIKSTGDLKERNWGIIGIKSKKGVVRIKYGPQA